MAPLNRAQACVALGVALLLLCNLIYRSHTPPLKPTLATPALVAHPPPPPPSPPPLSLYVFATFTDGRTLGEGMHLLVSSDGLSWRTLQGALLPGTARWWRRLADRAAVCARRDRRSDPLAAGPAGHRVSRPVDRVARRLVPPRLHHRAVRRVGAVRRWPQHHALRRPDCASTCSTAPAHRLTSLARTRRSHASQARL